MRCGRVAVIGRANAGKSTLINVIVGEKVSITSPKPQTTRDRILAVYNAEDCQIVFEDTPGVYKAANLLNDRMQKATENAAKDVDLILMLIDAHAGLKSEDSGLIGRFTGKGIPVIVALTKTDISTPERLTEAAKIIGENDGIELVTAISARTGKNVKKLIELIKKRLSEQEPLFPLDVISDKSERFMLGEIMREKILLKYQKEIPHGVAVIVNSFEKRKGGAAFVSVDIVCEKPNHKAILIGKQGKALKETASYARESMEKFLGCKVYLETYVKVKDDWRDRPDRLREYGYSEENFI